MKLKISVANLVMLAGGLITFIFSFLDFYKVGPFGANAWDTDAGAFVTTIPAILGLAMLVWTVLEVVGTKLPEKVLTFTGPQMKASWGISAGGMMLGWVTTGSDWGAGFWLMFIGSIAMAAGGIMGLLNLGSQTVDLSGRNPGSMPPPPPPPMPSGEPGQQQ
jgi:hypothetical protein